MELDLTIPPDTQMRALMDQDVNIYEWGDEILDALRFLNLWIYDSQDGFYRIGSLSEQLPHRDRWLYSIEQAPLHVVKNWRNVRVLIAFTCARSKLDMLPKDYDLFEALADTADRLEQALESLGPVEPQERARLVDNYLLGIQAFDYTDADEITAMIRAHWDQDTHDLLRHYDIWAARQAEALPREIALRLYSFGEYVDALERGVDWLI
jgi:hypothetical protein